MVDAFIGSLFWRFFAFVWSFLEMRSILSLFRAAVIVLLLTLVGVPGKVKVGRPGDRRVSIRAMSVDGSIIALSLKAGLHIQRNTNEPATGMLLKEKTALSCTRVYHY